MIDDDAELAEIRRKKMAQLLAREKKLREEREREEKVSTERAKLLKRFLAPDAASYLEGLRQREPAVAKRIEDVFLYLIAYRGIRQMFSQLDVRYVERQIKGEGPRIRIERDGETKDFGAYVREAIKKGSDED
ncbi:MAG: DNA-binding protein [Candidatus Thorarchaeota archaeon]